MNPYRSNKNTGAALVVSLVILLVITLLGIAGVGGAGMQLKLTSIAKERAQAFEAAEATLKAAEQTYIDNPPKISQFYTNAPKCTAGLCFKGKFDGSDLEICDALDADPSKDYTDYWSGATFWSSATTANSFTRTHTYYGATTTTAGTTTTATTTEQVKYIVEFLCLSPKTGGAEIATEDNTKKTNNNLATVLRITVHATGPSGRSAVNLQSVIKALLAFY